ncbi:uncharacterized protein EAF01_011562 [Botrytis porri]|nr:uncharacterized protein EAF01_011562 [Botrytis porri]KAF7884139.1 hypothetical protein EAF01_011562 [Botrytis porri]
MDEPGLSPRDGDDDDDDDDDDDNLHQNGRGRYPTYEATQSTYSTTSSDSSGSFDLSNNGYLDWNNNEGGWGQYNIDSEERCSNSLTSHINRARKNQHGMKRNNPGHDADDNEFISDSYSISEKALSPEPTNTLSTAFQGVETYKTSTTHIVGIATILKYHLTESTTAPETINDAYVRREDGSYHRISLAIMGIEREPSQVTLNSQRSLREYFHSSTHPSRSRERWQSSKLLRQWRKVHAKKDRKHCFESPWKHCTEFDEPCIREDSLRNHQALDRMHHFRDHLKSQHRRAADSLNRLLSKITFNHQSKLCPHVPAKEWKIRRVFKTSYSVPLHQRPEEYEDESLLTSLTRSPGETVATTFLICRIVF